MGVGDASSRFGVTDWAHRNTSFLQKISTHSTSKTPRPQGLGAQFLTFLSVVVLLRSFCVNVRHSYGDGLGSGSRAAARGHPGGQGCRIALPVGVSRCL